jgi:hypothetical protein
MDFGFDAYDFGMDGCDSEDFGLAKSFSKDSVF